MEQLTKTIICEYKYDSKDERNQHVISMESDGFECSGQVRKSDDSLMSANRNFYWYGRFYKRL